MAFIKPIRLKISLKVSTVSILYIMNDSIETDINAKKTSKSPIIYYMNKFKIKVKESMLINNIISTALESFISRET